MKASSDLKGLLPVAVASGAVLAVVKLFRPWYIHWGATAEEISRAMPLDESVPEPMLNSTMAVSIDAAPEDVWPWLAQIGDPPRGGYYSYTWIERWAGMHIENSDAVLPEYQHPEVGHTVDKNGTMMVLSIEPGRHLVLGAPPSLNWIQCAWSFGVYPSDGGTTRLVTRVRAHWSWRSMFANTPPLTWPMYLFIEPGAFVMERRMLREIKKRAERLARSRSIEAPSAVSSEA